MSRNTSVPMRAIRTMRSMRTTTLARCVLVMLAMSAGTVRRGELRDGNGWPTVDALEIHSFPLQLYCQVYKSPWYFTISPGAWRMA